MNDHEIPKTEEVEEAKLSVCEFVPRQDRVGTSKPLCSTNLYVKNFPSENCTEDWLSDTFKEFGALISVCIMKDEN